MKCRMHSYAKESWLEKYFPDAPPLTDEDGIPCRFRVNGECSVPDNELGIEFNLNGVMWCIPRSEANIRDIENGVAVEY